jgi:hypothetical protein
MLFKIDYTNPSNFTWNVVNPNTNICLDLTRNLPDVAAKSFTIDKMSNGGMYLATDVGVYYTNNEMLNNGTNWVEFGTNLPHVPITGLDINYAVNKLRATTAGRGMWQHDLYCPLVLNAIETLPHYVTDAYIEAKNTIYSTTQVPNNYKLTYRAGLEIELADGFGAEEGSEFGAFIHPCDVPYTNSFRKKAPLTNTPMYNAEQEQIIPLNAQAIQLYPNPTTGTVNVGTKAAILSIELYSVNGTIIYSANKTQRIDANNYTLQLTSLEQGVYFVKTKVEGGTIYNTKLVLYNN